MGCIMGNIRRFFAFFLMLCSLSLATLHPARAGWFGDAWDAVSNGVSELGSIIVEGGAQLGREVASGVSDAYFGLGERLAYRCYPGQDCDVASASQLAKIADDLKNGRQNSEFSHWSARANCPTCLDNMRSVCDAVSSSCNAMTAGSAEKTSCLQSAGSCLASVSVAEECPLALANDIGGALWEPVANTASSIWNGIASLFNGEDTLDAMASPWSSNKSFGSIYNKTLAAFLNLNQGCWFCSIFETVFKTVNNMATDVYNQLRDVFLSLLVVLAMAWLLWTVFKFITTIHGANIGELMTELFKGLGTIMLLAILLRAQPGQDTRYLVDIPMEIGAGLSMDIMKVGGVKTTVSYTSATQVEGRCAAASGQTQTMNACQGIASDAFAGKALSADVYNALNCLLKLISIELVNGLALGCAIIVYALNPNGGLPDLGLLVVGLGITLSFLIMFIKVPFKLIDLLLRMGFVVILLPLFIACFATKQTRGYSKKGWDLLVSCWVTLVTLCVFLAFAIQLIAAAFSG